MRRKLTLLISLFSVTAAFGQTEEINRKLYTTARIEGEAPRIDGLLNDEIWETVEWGGGDFTQRQPNDGGPPTEQTKFKVLYDDKNIYVAIRAYDADPANIVKRLSRRDGFEGDRVTVMFDSYNDKRTAFSFTATSAGVKGEEYVSNNGDDWDEKWDPIWYLMTSIDEEGWVAEMRIPLSQLRFADQAQHTWGFQVMRYYFRNDERSNWQHIPQNANGFVHRFGEINGINGIRPQKQLEIQPYIVAQTETYEKEEGNPYATGKGSDVNVGLDAKIGVTSDITLDLTVNPDFGQVEADPSQVNLSAFQLFFPEQRPFFIEGSNILTFPTGGREFDNLFYSRRVGRRPQGSIDTDPDGDDGVEEYVNSPNNTRILGSMKLTGKNKNGFSWGVLESVTREESAEIDSLGVKREQVVEPMTNYLVGRVQQEINQGETIVGGMVTATNRGDLKGLDGLTKEAYSAGADFTRFWKERKYFVTGRVLASQVKGDAESIINLQESSARFYQRADNDYRRVDTTLTKMSGTAGSMTFGKASGNFVYEIGSSWSSPGLELNDIGFLNQTDQVAQWVWAQYRKLEPFGIFRSMRSNINIYQNQDFGGDLRGREVNWNGHAQFKNFWRMSSGASATLYQASNADLRGGPSIIYPKSYDYWIWASSDDRKKVVVELNPWWGWGEDGYSKNSGWWWSLGLRPSNALNVRFVGSVSSRDNEMQYVNTIDSNGQPRYIIGNIHQRTYNLSMRVTYVLTPNMSIQYWGQPFAASGAYSNLKRVTNSTHDEYQHRFDVIGTTLNEADNVLAVDEDNDGTTDYTIDNPDFNFTQFQSNMVMRWEYKPGSTLFLVWTQNISENPTVDRHSFDHLANSLFDKQPRNIFLLKYTYRFVL
ncbi:MAG: DUF5916 domain-containing protein [Fulvivirga sp.]